MFYNAVILLLKHNNGKEWGKDVGLSVIIKIY